MSSQNQKPGIGDGEAKSTTSTALSSQGKSSANTSENDSMKRAAAKKLIERYFYQLTDGCGNSNCDNEFCASSGKVKALSANQAAAQAIQLFSQEARLCDAQPTKVARTQSTLSTKNEYERMASDDSSDSKISKDVISQETRTSSFQKLGTLSQGCEIGISKPVPYLTEEKLMNILETCKQENSYLLLRRTLGEIYSSVASLSISFKKQHSPVDAMLEKAPKDLKNLKKEDVRTMEGDMDKDEDSKQSEEQEEPSLDNAPHDDITVDLCSLRRAYEALFEVPNNEFESALVHALITLSNNIELDFLFGDLHPIQDILNVLVIVLEIPALGISEFLEMALPHICRAASHLSVSSQAWLARIWARHSKTRLKSILEALQQLITLKVILGILNSDYCVQDDEFVTAPTRLMKIVYYANILAGELDSPELRQDDITANSAAGSDDLLLGEISAPKNTRPSHQEDPLGVELGVNVLDARKPYIPFSEFYNEPLSDAIEMDKDFAYFKSEVAEKARKFSFMNYSFILTPATKTLGLYYDNRIRMYSERRISYYHTFIGQAANPYLRLKVKRENIIEDALVELELISMENPKDLKKQLVVEFEGEQGIDEGGVSKEFFQLIVEEIFNPDYGMFTFQQETQTVWFNPTSFESNAQFTLIGIVLGLAIYNNIILDVHFPMVVYRKLMGKKGTFYDLEDWNKTLFNSLKAMLDYEGDDMEEVFVQTFRVCYQDVFGSTFFHELKEGGEQILVKQTNKKEFVDLYADFLLNTSVDKQFRAFCRGFQMVTDESPLNLLFRPEEVEQLVCGSKNFDFNELEEATEYDGGYTSTSPVIRHFWEIVHNMPLDCKQKLLQFTTGSDRVPVGGLSRLKLIIARNGPDSDRLPTAHTCFNVLLLPEYETKEKLNDRLMKAINYSKGFGML